MWCNNLVSTANYSVCAEIVLLCFHLFGICKNMLFFQVGWIVFDLDTDICSLYCLILYSVCSTVVLIEEKVFLFLCWQYLILGKLKFLFYNIFCIIMRKNVSNL